MTLEPHDREASAAQEEPKEAPSLHPKSRRRSRLRRRLRSALLLAAGLSVVSLVVVLIALWPEPVRTAPAAVIATVNGREITLEDLQSEAQARGVAFDEMDASVILQAVIDRALLAQQARALHLDRSPTYPAERMRVEEALLAATLTRPARSLGSPSDSQINQFIQTHPFTFGQRQLLHLKQLRFAAPPDRTPNFDTAETFDDLRASLKAHDIPADEGLTVIDTAELTPELDTALIALRPEAVLITRQGSQVVGSSLLAVEAAPLTKSDAVKKAVRLIAEQQDRDRAQSEAHRLRALAKITYQKEALPHS